MRYSGGHKGYGLRRRPGKYPTLPQQKRFSDALKFCGIEKGISKQEMMVKMKTCIPIFFKGGEYGQDQDLHSEALPTVQGDGGTG